MTSAFDWLDVEYCHLSAARWISFKHIKAENGRHFLHYMFKCIFLNDNVNFD